jgi:hypothetical protein
MNPSVDDDFKKSILTRLHFIETTLGISTSTAINPTLPSLNHTQSLAPRVNNGGHDSMASTPPRDVRAEDFSKEQTLPDLRTALEALKKILGPNDREYRGWDTNTVEALWLS